MKYYSSKILDLFPEDILEKTYEKTFLPEETITFLDENICFFILEGDVVVTRTYEDRIIYFPRILKPGELCGHYSYIMQISVQWEFMSLTKSKLLIIPDKLLRNTILEDSNLYKELTRLQTFNIEYAMNFYFLQSQINNRATYAYFLIMNSVDNIFTYIKHEYMHKLLNISRTSFHNIEKEFLENGYIKKVHKKIVIINSSGVLDLFKDYIVIRKDLNR